jgi:hypothetical protein
LSPLSVQPPFGSPVLSTPLTPVSPLASSAPLSSLFPYLTHSR